MSEPLQGLLHLVRRHPAGTVLFREGDPGEKMFLIRAGKVNIVKRIADSEITLAVLGPGEMSRSGAARALTLWRTVAEPPDARGRDADTYTTYLSLKHRFEYA